MTIVISLPRQIQEPKAKLLLLLQENQSKLWRYPLNKQDLNIKRSKEMIKKTKLASEYRNLKSL